MAGDAPEVGAEAGAAVDALDESAPPAAVRLVAFAGVEPFAVADPAGAVGGGAGIESAGRVGAAVVSSFPARP